MTRSAKGGNLLDGRRNVVDRGSEEKKGEQEGRARTIIRW